MRTAGTQRLQESRSAHTVTVLPDGRILVVGGATGRTGRELASAELLELVGEP